MSVYRLAHFLYANFAIEQIVKAATFGTVRSMTSLIMDLEASEFSADLCFSTGFALGFVEEPPRDSSLVQIFNHRRNK